MKCCGLKRSITRGCVSFSCSLILAVKDRRYQRAALLPIQHSMSLRRADGCRSTPLLWPHHSAGERSAVSSKWVSRGAARARPPLTHGTNQSAERLIADGIAGQLASSLSSSGPIEGQFCPSCFTADFRGLQPAASRVSRLNFFV